MPSLIPVLITVSALFLPGGEGGKRPTIEELIEISKQRAEKNRSVIEARIREILPNLELAYEKNASFVGEKIDELAKLGPSAIPFLIPLLNNAGTDDRSVQKGRNAAIAITRMESPEVTAECMKLLENGTKEGKRNAIVILGKLRVTEAEKALQEFLSPKVEEDLRLAAIIALGRMKSENSIAALTTLLKTADHKTAGVILDLFENMHTSQPVQTVAGLLTEPYFRPLFQRLLNYLVLMGSKDSLPQLVKALSLPDLSSSQIILLVQSIGKIGAPTYTQGVAALRPFLSHADKDVRDETTYALNELGDESGVKALLIPYDDYLKEYYHDPRAFESRGKVLLRLHRYRDALRDFKEGIRVAKKDVPLTDLYVYQARCQAALNQFKEAYNSLKATELDASLLAKYKELPEFKLFKDHEKYGQIFGK